MAKKKNNFHFYLDRWLQSMKIDTLKSLKNIVPQLSAIGHVTQKLRNWGNRHAIINRHPLFKIYDSHLMRSQFCGDENPYLIINQKKSHEDIHFHIPQLHSIFGYVEHAIWIVHNSCVVAVDVLWMKDENDET